MLDKLRPNHPVHKELEKWYFWDETWAHRYGPFETAKEANEALNYYMVTELGLLDKDFENE